MKNIEDVFYNIKDLRIVMIDKDYVEKQHEDSIQYFNENVQFIVEKCVLEYKDKNGLPYVVEYYTECITEEDLSERLSHRPFKDTPEIFSSVSEIPMEYFTEDELKEGKVSIKRIYKILQDINMNREIESEKVKRIGEKK